MDSRNLLANKTLSGTAGFTAGVAGILGGVNHAINMRSLEKN